MSRPICVHCGAKYGTRVTTEECFKRKPDEPMPRYTGNGIVVSQTERPSIADWDYSAYPESKPFNIREYEVTRRIWNGVSYWRRRYEPFCTLRCALDYARKAYAKHGRAA
jgi:hypothetical protein